MTATYGDPLSLFTGDEGGFNRGDAIMILAGLFYAGYSVGLRSKPDVDWLSLLAALVAGGCIAALAGVGVEYAAGQLQWPTTLQGFAVALYAGIFPSLVSQGFFIRGVDALGANTAGLYINLVPVFGAILSVLLLGEGLYLYHFIAFALVVGGIILAQAKAAK